MTENFRKTEGLSEIIMGDILLSIYKLNLKLEHFEYDDEVFISWKALDKSHCKAGRATDYRLLY